MNFPIETIGEWKLFTKGDFKHFRENIRLLEHFNGQAHFLETLEKYTEKLSYEHGKEGKIPRVNMYRPYRFTINHQLAAIIALRASEAFNFCEIDAFTAIEIPGLKKLETTKKALLFIFCDAVRSGGSMAVQFSENCLRSFKFDQIEAVAEDCKVELSHTESGVLSPSEVRELFLKLCLLPSSVQARVRQLAGNGFFSFERVCYMIASEIWPVLESSFLMLNTPFPEFILGSSIPNENRILSSHAFTHGASSILVGLFDSALCYLDPVREDTDTYVERAQYAKIPHRIHAEQYSVVYGPLHSSSSIQWNPQGEKPVTFPKQSNIVAFPRPHSLEMIRIFFTHDLEEASRLKSNNFHRQHTIVTIIYPADFYLLTPIEREKALEIAKQFGVLLLICPETYASLENEVSRRLRIGKAIRA